MTPWLSENTSWKTDISNLRLVNRKLNTVFSYLLFQNIEIHFHPFAQYVKVKRDPKKLAKLVNLSQSKMCDYVENLVIRFSGLPDSYYGLDKATARFFQDFCHYLPLCIKACHNIKYLDLLCHDIARPYNGNIFPVDFCDQINITLATVLTQVNLERLEHLILRLPQAADFAAIVRYDRDSASSEPRQPLRKILSSLSSLTLQICDPSGMGNPAYYKLSGVPAFNWDYERGRDEEAFFYLTGLAAGATSLDLICESQLKFDVLIMGERQVFRNLSNLSLRKLQVSGKALVQLLQETVTTLERIDFNQVELLDQTWEDVCTQMCSSSLLHEVKLASCRYATNGYTHHLRGEAPHSWAMKPSIPASIESLRFGDISVLCELVELVNIRRQERGLCTMGCTWYQRDPNDVSGKGMLSRGSFWHVPEQERFEM